MSFRDDHDAAIARIDALEGELATAMEERERDKREIRRLERRIAQLEGKDDSTIEFTPETRVPEMPGWISMASRVLGLVVFTMIALILILGATAPG